MRIRGLRAGAKTAFNIRQLTIYVLSALLSACATGAQRELAREQQVSTESISAGRDCVEGIYAKPDYVHLKTKMFLDAGAASAPLQYSTDTSRPTKTDIADIYKLHADLQPCRKIFLTGAASVHPAIVNVLFETYDTTDKLWVEFASGRMTWGNFNQRRQSIGVRTNQQINEARAMIASQLQNQHQYEIAQRQRAAAAMQQWAYQQQVLENQRRAINAINAASAPSLPMNSPVINCQYQGAGMMTCR